MGDEEENENSGLLLKLPQSTARELRQKFELKKDLQHEISDETKPENLVAESLPLVLVNLERLTGYQPDGDDHKETLLESLGKAMFDDENGSSSLSQLLEAGLAFHSDTSQSVEETLHVLHYPECIGELSTRHMWRTLQRPRSIPVVERLVQHLRVCHQPLVWKYSIQREIEEIVDTMSQHRRFLEWNNGVRKRELAKLYLVRETLQDQLEIAQAEKVRLEEERECLVEEEMNELNGGITEFFVGDAQESEDEDDYEPYVPSDFADEDKENKNIGSDEEEQNSNDSGSDDDTEADIPQIDETENKAALLREQFTTDELRKAAAKSTAMEQHMEKVDAILESLQDEEWAEEEGLGDEVVEQFDERTSVLHPILAMILFSLDFQPADPIKHNQQLKLEHYTITRDWKKHFGQLPPPLPSKQRTLDDERQRLGIHDNDQGDWDA